MDPTFVGDMKLTQKQLEAFEKGQDLDAAPESGNAFAIHNSKERRWKDGIIPYTFDCSVGMYTRCICANVASAHY